MIKKGFTLLELLIAISIVGLLSSTVIPTLTGARRSAQDTVRISDISQLALAMEITVNKITGEYTVLTNTTPQAIGTEFPEVPENNLINNGVYGWLDNTNEPFRYCAWATLVNEVNDSTYFVASEIGAGYIDVEPSSFDECVYYEEDNQNTGLEDSNKRSFVCHRNNRGRFRTLNVGNGAISAHLEHGDTLGSC